MISMSSVAPDITATTLKRNGKFQSLPSYQAKGQVFTPSVRNLPSEYPATIFSAAQKYISRIPKVDNIDHMLLRIQHTVSVAPVGLVPVNYWFREMTLRQGAGADLIQTQYDDSAQANLLTVCTAGREQAIFKSINMESTTSGKYGVTKQLLPGVYTFWVPILSSVFAALQGVYLDNLEGDLYLDLTTPSTIIASGSGTITTNISFDIEGVKLNEWDKQKYNTLYKQTAFEGQYLQPFRSEFLNTTLTAGSDNNFTLDNVDGLCSHQMILIRPSGCYTNNAGFSSWKLLNVGDSNGSTLDLVSNSGESYIGGARPTRYIRQHQSIDNMDNGFWSTIPAYHLVYCDNIRAALSGVVKGARWFKSQNRDQIRLHLPAAPVAEVQTITFSAVPAIGGFYAFSYKGDQSAQLPANASTATMQTTIQAMKTFAARFITVTCSASASAGTSFTVTFNDPQGELVGDVLEVLSHDGLAASAATARTVAAVPGLASGQYDVVVYSYIYRVACYNGTKLHTKLMLQ